MGPCLMKPHSRGERPAQGHRRRRLALASLSPHNSAMPPDLTDDDKAIIVELLRETVEGDRFPLPRPTPTIG